MANRNSESVSLPTSSSASVLAAGSSNTGTINNPKVYGTYIKMKIVNGVKEVVHHATKPVEKPYPLPESEQTRENHSSGRNFFYERLFLRYYLFPLRIDLLYQLVLDSSTLLSSMPTFFIREFLVLLKRINYLFSSNVVVLHDMPDSRFKDANFELDGSFLQRNDIYRETYQHLVNKNIAVYQASSGSGKSVAAMYFFHLMKKSGLYNYLIWCDASSKAALDECFCESYKTLTIVTENNYEINIDCQLKSAQFASNFSNWLNNVKKSWMLVLDDAQERQAMGVKLNADHIGKTLVTTQSFSWGEENYIQGFSSSNGQVLSFSDAKTLFFKTFNIDHKCRNRSIPSDSDLRNFFNKIGTLPLVLVQSAHTICHEIVHGIRSEQPLVNYLKEYLVQPTDSLPSGDPHNIIHKVVALTLKQLDATLGHLESDPTKRTLELVRNYLYLLSPKKISKTYFCEILNEAGNVSSSTCGKIVKTLDRRIIENLGGGYFFVHDSIHSALKNRDKVTPETELTLEILLNYFTKKYFDKRNNLIGVYDVMQNLIHVRHILDYVKSLAPNSDCRVFYQHLLGNILNDEIGSYIQAQILLRGLLKEIEGTANSIYDVIKVNSSSVTDDEYIVLTNSFLIQRDLAFAERNLGNFEKQSTYIQRLLIIISDIQKYKNGIPEKWQMKLSKLYFEFAQNFARAIGDQALNAQGDARIDNARIQIESCEELISLQMFYSEIDQDLIKSCELTIANAYGIMGNHTQQIILLEKLITDYPSSENDVAVLTSLANAYSLVNSTKALNYADQAEAILKSDAHTNNTCYQNYDKCLDSYRIGHSGSECSMTVCMQFNLFINKAIAHTYSGNLREAYLSAEKAFYLTYFISDYGPDHFYTKQAQNLFNNIKASVTAGALECLTANPDVDHKECSKIITCTPQGRMHYVADPIYECGVFGIPAIGKITLRGRANICTVDNINSSFVYNNVLNATGLLESVNQQNLAEYFCNLPSSKWSIIAQNLYKGPLLGTAHGLSDLIYLNKIEPLLERKLKNKPHWFILGRFLIPFIIYATILMICDRFLPKEQNTSTIQYSFFIGLTMTLLDVLYISINNSYIKGTCTTISSLVRLGLMGTQAFSLCTQDGVENTNLVIATSIHFGLLAFARKPIRQLNSIPVQQEANPREVRPTEGKKTI